MEKQIKIKDNFYLIKKELTTSKVVNVRKPINHLLVCDISGSMAYDLPKLRQSLKNKIPNLITHEDDTITIIWFSSNNQVGILKEAVQVKNILQLEELNKAIDMWLKPLSLTAFAPPLKLVKDVIKRIKLTKPNSIFSMLFYSDGLNNDSVWSEVINNAKLISEDLAYACVIEFGFYTSQIQTLALSEALGAEKVLAEDFDSYELIFEEKISKPLGSGKKILVEIPAEYRKYDFAFVLNDNKEILTYGINLGESTILLSENTSAVYYFRTASLDNATVLDTNENDVIEALYTSIYLLSDRNYIESSEDVYSVLGDKFTFDIFVNSFGKQKLNEFKNLIKECILDSSKRFLSGRVDNLIIEPNTYCLMNLIQDLTLFENNLFFPMHPDFKYNRIGQKKVQKSTSEFSTEDKERLSMITDINELKSVIEELSKKYNDFELKFITTDSNKGYPLNELVWNSTRANLSIQVMYHGTVALPENQFGLESIDTVQFKNYSIIKDSLINIPKLFVSLNKHTYNILRSYNLIQDEPWKEDKIFILNLGLLPVVNRSMTQSISAENLAQLEWKLLQDKGATKVYKYYENKLFPTKSLGYVEKYGQDATLWLNSLGFSEGNGFSPKTEFVESTDFYMSVNLETKIAGCSSLPKVEDVIPKVEKLLEIESKLQGADMLSTADSDKLKAEKSKLFKVSETLLVPAIKDYLTQTSSKLYLSQTPEVQLEILRNWIKDAKVEANKARRSLMQSIAQIKFSLILSRSWFSDFKSMEENELEVELIKGEKPLKVKFDLTEKEEKI